VPGTGRIRKRRAAGSRGAVTIGITMAVRAVSAPLAQLPNALTVLRLVLIPVFVALVLGSGGDGSWTAAAIFAWAGASDQIDGWLARRWQVESEFGKFADPLADRLMIDAAIVLLWLDGRLPWPALAVILVRDGALILGYGAIRNRGYEFAVNFVGKVATGVLYAGLTGVVASGEGTEWPLWIFWTGLTLAVAAGALYAVSAWRAVRG
jgi:CDP-diacylglycerol--glycerol-3-phosphate 3-phosphatidyltransferase